jgi:hypothetical protein
MENKVVGFWMLNGPSTDKARRKMAVCANEDCHTGFSPMTPIHAGTEATDEGHLLTCETCDETLDKDAEAAYMAEGERIARTFVPEVEAARAF